MLIEYAFTSPSVEAVFENNEVDPIDLQQSKFYLENIRTTVTRFNILNSGATQKGFIQVPVQIPLIKDQSYELKVVTMSGFEYEFNLIYGAGQ